MKITKDAIAAGRRLYRLCLQDGKLNEESVRKVIASLTQNKPRNYRGILMTLQRQMKHYFADRHVLVESAKELDTQSRAELEGSLRAQHGGDLTFEYTVQPELLGGMRVRKGDDVWDGSVKARLQRLSEAF